jgi:4-diphosphocytidyl-2-C-methyl-D-erythritol kinase
MLLFPNCKINLGLAITEKRPDGYHNLQTVFYPIGLSDLLEFVEDPSIPAGQIKLAITGIEVGGDPLNNLCSKAFRLLCNDFALPGLSVHLHKIIPIGAGLGGGSSDAAFMLKGINNYFNLSLTDEKLEEYASRLGSDCAFFIRNHPVSAYEKGNKFADVTLDLSDYYVLLINPGIHISTAEAYARVTPALPLGTPEMIVQTPVTEWKDSLTNDFEKSVFPAHPEIAEVKEMLYEHGALYASMSGSGSSVFGIYDKPPVVPEIFGKYFIWSGPLKSAIG